MRLESRGSQSVSRGPLNYAKFGTIVLNKYTF